MSDNDDGRKPSVPVGPDRLPPADPRIEKSGFAPVEKSTSRPPVPAPEPAPSDGIQ